MYRIQGCPGPELAVPLANQLLAKLAKFLINASLPIDEGNTGLASITHESFEF